MNVHLAIFLLLLCAACSYALWCGGGPERAAAATMMAGVVATRLTFTALPMRYRTLEWPMLLIDGLVLAAFVAIAMRADRRWPLAVATLHALSVGAHAVKVVQPDTIRTVYWMMTNLWIYPQLALLATGTWFHRRRLAMHGADPSWSNYSGRS